jgi:hypothetical protein
MVAIQIFVSFFLITTINFRIWVLFFTEISMNTYHNTDKEHNHNLDK